MAESIYPHALTTLQRVKDRISETSTSFDSVLTRMINSATDWIERECGNRRFVQTTYYNEIYSSNSRKMQKIILRQAPVIFQTVTGNISGATISQVSSTTGMVVGMAIKGDNIPQYNTPTTIASISQATVGISRAATAVATGAIIQFNGIISFQYRAGPPSNPTWTDFLVDQYELVNDGKAGIVRVYGGIPDFFNNMIRVTYSAGYPINWDTAGDNSKHLLPMSITDVCENIVVRKFKRRMLAGKGSEALGDATTSWNKDIDVEDQAVIDQFRRMTTIF